LLPFFGITKEELEACRKYGLFSEKEQTNIGLSRELFENLALRFEVANPDAADEELIEYLKAKADELRKIKKRLSEIEVTNTALDNQIAAANAALESGHFEEADKILAAAEELQQEERTIREVRMQSDLRLARGDAALFKGDSANAAKHYLKAANYFSGFDTEEVATILTNSAGYIYEIERRSHNPNFANAIELAERALELTDSQKQIARWVRAKYRLALLQQVMARTKTTEFSDLLGAAIINIDEALERVGSATAEDRFDWASLMVLKGNCYLERSHHRENRKWEQDVTTAIDIFDSIANDPRLEETGPHRFHIFNNISSAYQFKASRSGERGDGPLARNAKQAAIRAIEISAQEGMIDEWATAQINLGAMLAEAATAAPPQKAYFLRIQAIAAFGAAMEAYPKTTFSLQLARAQFLLGRVCLDQATASDERMQEVYLLRSIGAYEASSLNFDKDSHLDEWSECHFCIGLAFLIHSETSDKDVAIDDLQKAINQFEVALPGFQAINSENLKKLEKARQRAIETLDKLRQP